MGHKVGQRGFDPEDYRVVVSMGGMKEGRHSKCKGYYLEFQGDYDCEYSSNLICEDCKYGAGKKDPEALCNHS